jgi:sugar O-acyltransferase (sialic acid O-acetyltransferase NeuD family)
MMSYKTWTIFGAGNLIGDFIDAVESRDEKVACIVLNMDLDEKIMRKIPSSIKVIKLSEFIPSSDHFFFGFIDPHKQPFIGGLKKFNLIYSNLIHRHSYLPDTVKMGQGNFIGAGVVLGSSVSLGNFNYINRMASIGHDTQVLDFNEFSPACTVAGCCLIGSRNHLYSGSVIIDNLRLGDDITIGAGGVVVKDLGDPGIYVGVPVKKIK